MTSGNVAVWLVGITVLWGIAWVRRSRLGMGEVALFVAALIAIAVVLMIWPLG